MKKSLIRAKENAQSRQKLQKKRTKEANPKHKQQSNKYKSNSQRTKKISLLIFHQICLNRSDYRINSQRLHQALLHSFVKLTRTLGNIKFQRVPPSSQTPSYLVKEPKQVDLLWIPACFLKDQHNFIHPILQRLITTNPISQLLSI